MNEIGSNNYFGSSALLDLSKASRRATAAASPSGDATPSEDARQKLLDAYQKRWAEARQAIARLPRPEDAAQMKKAAAAEKVERLKSQIRMLKTMGMIGDPKANARQIAQLAKELAAAVREYASAGGAARAAPAAATTDTTTGAADGNAVSPADAQNGETDAEAESAASSGPRQADANAGDAGPDAASATASAAVSQYRNTQMQSSSGSDADRDFIREVKELLAQLKALARQQAARLRQQGNSAEDGDVSKVDQILGDIEKNLSGIGLPGMEVSVAV